MHLPLIQLWTVTKRSDAAFTRKDGGHLKQYCSLGEFVMSYLGIDVSKNKIDCCFFYEKDSPKKKNKIFPNQAKGFDALNLWLSNLKVDPQQTIILMEATSIYHELLAEFLFSKDFNVCVANPARARYFAKSMSKLNKTDKVDSEVLAQFAMTSDLHYWKPLAPHIKLLNALLERRAVLLEDLLRERNRLEKADFINLVEPVLASIQASIQYLQIQIKDLDQQINDHIDQNSDLKKDRQLLCSIPAIADQTSLLMLSFFHSHTFEKASQAAAFVGLVPIHRQSGSSIRSRSRLSKAGSAKIRSGLYMSAVVATQHNPHIKQMSERLLSNGKSKMMAIGAAMRKLIHICFGVLKHQQPYQANYST